MEKLKLMPISAEYADAIWDYRQEFLDEEESIHGAFMLEESEKIEDWLAFLEEGKNAEKMKSAGFVVTTSYLLVRELDERVLGVVNLRHELNENLRKIGGHIGYSVRKSERRKGYATRMVAMTLELARSLGLDRVLITCDKRNKASRKTILSNGGVYVSEFVDLNNVNEITEHYWVDLK